MVAGGGGSNRELYRLLTGTLSRYLLGLLSTWGTLWWERATFTNPELRRFGRARVERTLRLIRNVRNRAWSRGNNFFTRERLATNVLDWLGNPPRALPASTPALDAILPSGRSKALVKFTKNMNYQPTYRNRYRLRKYRKYKRGRMYKSPKLKYGVSIPRPLNGISNYRKIICMQRVPIVIPTATAAATTWEGLVSENGINKAAIQFRVGVQPFTTVGLSGTNKMYHSCCPLKDSSGTSIMGVAFSQAEYYDDIIKACQRYGSMRVGAMRVVLCLSRDAVGYSGAEVQNWNMPEVLHKITSAFDPYDNAENDTSDKTHARQEESPTVAVAAPSTYPSCLTTAVMRRLQNYKEHDFMPAVHGYHSVFKKVLFNRRFPALKSPETRGPIGSVGANTTQSVMPGQWDHRATYDTSYATAFDAANCQINRCGALYVDIRHATGINGDGEGMDSLLAHSAQATCLGYVEVTHEIHLKNDLDSLGRDRS